MIGGETVLDRWWRLAPWSGNPLMRRSDRIESLMVLIMVGVVLMLVPIAGAVGTATHTRLTEQAQQAAANGQQVPAVLLENPRPPMGEEPTRGPTGQDQVRARWVVDGTEHTGIVDTGTGARAGQTVTVWVDKDGNYMAAPNTATDNALGAIGAALGFLMLGTVGCGLFLIGFHWLLAKHHRSQLQREWQGLGHAPGWSVN
ncbi:MULTISPECIES: Rv1733c family protein [Rhodococcus]|uniref:Transmembrane protein n=1 Tax=Rhodococcus opacus RKJ300 = JCM 13270 TaxID=1165867 RepID=I0WN56_RHOOP|nr:MULTISPECIES: DUF3592 domain-containing protein [Rhodococcus]EID77822.1 hypothetical protein W59_21738 [Rhodococcus opacus RKJ300 = JCM 13270]